MERLKGYTTLPFHSTLRVLHLQVESAAVGNDENYKTKGADAFLKRVEKILKQQSDVADDELAQTQSDIFKVLALYEGSGPRR